MVGVGLGPGVASRMHSGMIRTVSSMAVSVLNPFHSLMAVTETAYADAIVLSVSFALTVYFTVWQAARVAAADSIVAVAAGGGVAVGRGTSIFCPACRFVH